MIRNRFAIFVLAVILFPVLLQTKALAQSTGDAAKGGELARTWCAACHVVAPDQEAGSVDVPTFASIAERYGDDIGVLAAFLADPHPVMPDMSLTRREIKDLIAYISSLRETE